MGLDRSKLSLDQLAQLEQYEASKKQLEALEGIGKKLQSVVIAIQAQQSKGEKGTGDLGTLLMDIRESLDELKDKETPESPDFSKPVVQALSKLENKLVETLNRIETTPEFKPNINVDSKTDLGGVEKILKNEVPKAFEKAIKAMPKSPETDLSPLEDRLKELSEKLSDIDIGVRSKPLPGSMKVTNPDGSDVGASFDPAVHDRIASGLITTQNANPNGDSATGGSTVQIDTEGPYNTLAIQTVGTYTGALTVQGTINGINWVSYAGSQILNVNTGLYLATITSALQSTFLVDISGFKKVRVSANAAVTGSVAVSLRASEGDSPRGALGVLTTVTTVGTVTNITNQGHLADNAAFTDGTTRLMMNGYVFDEVAGTALTENDGAAARVDSKRAQIYVQEDATTRGQRQSINANGAASVTQPQFSSTTNTSVASSATSVTLIAANANRKELTIQNDSSAILYIKEGATASATDYKYKLNQDDVYRTNNYTGIVDGIWASATGAARVAES